MNAVSFDCCGGCIPLEPGQSVQDVIDIHAMDCDERQRLNFLAEHRDEMHRDFAILGDRKAIWLNEFADDDPHDPPFEVSGDALALYQEKHS